MNNLKVFISHKTEDKKVAKVVKKQLESWSVPSTNIFLSSFPGQGIEPGKELQQEIVRNIENSNFFILVHTYQTHDWSRCMIEYGSAIRQNNIKVVVLQCTEDVPPVFEGPIFSKVNRHGINDLVYRIHKDVGFIPDVFNEDGYPIALAPHTREDLLNDRSKNFLAELKKVLPDGEASSRHIWDFLRIHLPSESFNEIREVINHNQKDKKENVIFLLKQHAEVRKPKYKGINYSNNSAVRQFGYQSYQKGLKLQDLFQRWEDNQDNISEKDLKWIDEIYETIYAAIDNALPPIPKNHFKTLRESAEWYFLPIVTRSRQYPDNVREFDIYLVRVDPNYR